jgi:hypothetical protein
MRTVAVIFCSLSDLAAVLAAGLGQTAPSPTPQPPEPVKLPEPAVAQQQPQPEPPKAEEQPPAPANAAPSSTEEPPRRRPRGSQEKPATDPKTPAEAIVPAPTPLGPAPRQDPYGAISEEKPTDRPFRQRGPSVRPSSDGPPSINFDEIPENP